MFFKKPTHRAGEKRAKSGAAQVIEFGDPTLVVHFKPSARARRLSLRVSRLDGKVTLSAPVSVARSEAMDFLIEREAWIRGHLSQVAPRAVVGIGDTIMFRGENLRILAGQGRGVHCEGDGLYLPRGSSQKNGARLLAFLKANARDDLVAASDFYAKKLGKSYHALTIRDTRSRWGSCSSAGKLMYSWRLIMAPPAVLNYVAAHEVSHLAHMDHSAAFWAQVGALDANYRQSKDWLREHGSALHRFQFR